MVKTSAPLQIRLTEPVIFLRGPSTGLDARGRPQVVRNDGQPAMLRGLLTLRLGKPTRIRSISIQFTGKARTEWPEGKTSSLLSSSDFGSMIAGIGLRRMDTHEEHILLSESVIFFSSRDRTASRSRSTRRAASLGPGITLSQWDLNDEDLDDNIVLHGVPDENAEMSDWVAVSRRDRDDAFRSSSTMSGRRGSLPRHPDSFPMRPNSLDRANVSPMDESPALGTLERGDLNASPAYTPHVEPHPVQPRQSSLRQSSSPMPLTESGLSPIVSAAPSRAGSDSDESAEVGPRRLDPIQRNISLRQGLVEPYSSRLPQMDDFAVEDEDALHPDSRTNDVPTGNRAASIRTMHSAFSVSSTSISTPPHEHTSGGNHPTVTPVQNASAESPEIDSPVLPPGVLHRDRATHDDLPGSSPFRSSTNDRVLPDNDLNLVAPVNGSSRRSSLLSRDSARVSWETAAGPSPIRSSSDLPEVRPGRKSRLGNDSRIVSHNNSVPGPSTHRPFVPGPYSQDSEPPRRSNSGTNSLATRESNRGTSMEANRESSEDGRDRRASRFSLSAALRGLNKGRMSSKSQTRGDESRTYSLNEASPPNPSVNIPTARRMSGLAIPTRLLRGGRNGRQTRSESVGQADDFVASYGRDEARGRSQSRGSLAEAKEETLENHGRGRNKGMKVLTGALGLSMNHFENREEPDNWKEFRKGEPPVDFDRCRRS